jgi:uncharacterized membrane protein YgdD (TMEM256/DUF423 family)
MMASVALVIAGLMGAAGVIAAALAAHSVQGPALVSASSMLLVHALAVVGVVSLLDGARLWRPAAALAIAVWIVGGVLFAGDIGLRAYSGQRLFSMAAPTGGSMLIVGWVLLTVSAIAGSRA